MRRYWWTSPAFRAGAVFAGLALAGVLALALGWFGASGTADASNQVAFALSGGAGGLALVVAGCGLLMAHVGRCLATQDMERLDHLVTSAYAVVRASWSAPAGNGTGRRPARNRPPRSGS